jgi:hypothetical protein
LTSLPFSTCRFTFTPGSKHGLRAQQPRELGIDTSGASKYLGSGQMRSFVPYCGPYGAGDLELLDDVAVREHDPVHLAVALDLDFHALGQRVGHGDADAVQSAGEGVRAAAVLLVELAAACRRV